MYTAPESIPASIIALVKHKARRMVGQAGLTTSDVEDVEHDLLLKVLQCLASYDSSKASLETYARTVVNRKAANIVRDRKAARRDPRRQVSLNVTVRLDEGESVELAQQISRRELEARTSGHSLKEQEEFELAHDMAEVIASLDHIDRELICALKWQSLTQIARSTGIPRSTLQYRLKRLRRRLEESGIREYLS